MTWDRSANGYRLPTEAETDPPLLLPRRRAVWPEPDGHRKAGPHAELGEGLSVHYSGGATLSEDITAWLQANGLNP